MSFYDDAKTISLMSGASGKDGKIYNVKPVEELSSTDLAINGNFSIDGPGANGELSTAFGSYGWNTIATNEAQNQQEGTSTIANGVLTLTNSAGDQDARAYLTNGSSTRNIITVNTYYRLRYRVVENTDCTDFKVYHNAGQFVDAPGTVGEHTLIIRNTINQLFLFTNTTESSSISIDDVSLKEITNETADFNFYRGTNLTASRVGKDGYIEIGNVQSARNTTWADAGDETAPTGWNDFTSGTGTYDVTNVPGQIQFVTDASSRSILISQSFVKRGNYVLSVTVDRVITACRIEQVLGISGNATEVTYFKDGVVVTRTDDVEEGSRYSVWVNKDNTSSTGFRVGIGANGNIEGNITLSKPQIAYGFAPLPYVENTSTTSTKEFGVLSDEPRFDYTGGGCPKLLIEPQRLNDLSDSNYFNSNNWGETRIEAIYDSSHKSPEGILSASKVELPIGSTDETHFLYSHPRDFSTGEKWAISIFAKQTVNKNRVSLTVLKSTDFTSLGFDEPVFNLDDGTITGDSSNAKMVDMGNGWWRCSVVSSTNTTTAARLIVYITDSDGTKSFTSTGDDIVYLFGAQWEKGGFATSYIPTNYGTETRTIDGRNSSSDQMIPGDAFDLTGDFGILFSVGDVTTEQGTSPSSMVMLYLITGTAGKNLGFFYNPSNDHGINVHLPGGNGNYVFGSTTNDAAAGDSSMLLTYNATTDRLAYYINGVLYDSTTTALSFDSSVRGYFHATNKTTDGDEMSFEIDKIIFFDNDLSAIDAEILTLKSNYNSFEEAATKLNYTIYE